MRIISVLSPYKWLFYRTKYAYDITLYEVYKNKIVNATISSTT